MNALATLASVALCLIVCLVALAQAGGDKSARTTVITLAGGGDKSSGGYPIPIPVPVCAGKMHSYGHGGHGHGHGGFGHGGGGGGGHGGYQARMGWRRR